MMILGVLGLHAEQDMGVEQHLSAVVRSVYFASFLTAVLLAVEKLWSPSRI